MAGNGGAFLIHALICLAGGAGSFTALGAGHEPRGALVLLILGFAIGAVHNFTLWDDRRGSRW